MSSMYPEAKKTVGNKQRPTGLSGGAEVSTADPLQYEPTPTNDPDLFNDDDQNIPPFSKVGGIATEKKKKESGKDGSNCGCS